MPRVRLHRRADNAALTVPHLIRGEGVAGELEHLLLEAAIDCLAAKSAREAQVSYRNHTDIVNRFFGLAMSDAEHFEARVT